MYCSYEKWASPYVYLSTYKHDELNPVNTIHHSEVVPPSMPVVNLATASKTQNKVQGGFLLDVVVT